MTNQQIAEKKLSAWLIALAVILCATMMRPTFGSVITILLVIGVLIAARKAAMVEGAQKTIPRGAPNYNVDPVP